LAYRVAGIQTNHPSQTNIPKIKILLMRMVGLGDVASILVPAVRLVQTDHPGATIDVLTHGPGVELMQLMPEVNAVLAVSPAQWPRDLLRPSAALQTLPMWCWPRGTSLSSTSTPGSCPAFWPGS